MLMLNLRVSRAIARDIKYEIRSHEITLNAILITAIYPPPARRRDVRLDIEAVQLIVN